jgi:hypothetical protein
MLAPRLIAPTSIVSNPYPADAQNIAANDASRNANTLSVEAKNAMDQLEVVTLIEPPSFESDSSS